MPLVPALPAPLTGFAKWGMRVLPAVWAAGEALLDYPTQADDNDEVEWRRLVVVWQRATPVGTEEDHAMITFDLINITGGQVDNSWITSDYVAAEGPMGNFLTIVAGYQSSSHTVIQLRWYRMKFANPMLPNRRILPTGPPLRIVPLNIPGASSSTALPYQVAMSVTERTAIPKHWGRFYIPGAAAPTTPGSYGRFASGTVSAITTATHAMYTSWSNAQLYPVVVSTQVDNVLGPGLLGVTNIQVDDIPDVIRRRRPKQPLIRNVLPALPTPAIAGEDEPDDPGA